ncbi:hypothetical protein GCM10023200_49470 [Actinomycetospora chlora]|jgi:hypothetical protein|uniref:YtxH domain-containing protein n=2 Tax=Actinomycetospora chlora TaxID=663608 RepID=A0ABP9C739_9PSEU
MKMIPFLLGAGVGYVLGARAGRERYEQIARAYRQVADHPSVQGAAGVARAKAGEAVQTGVAMAKERVAPSGSGGHEPAAPGRSTTNGSGR